MSNQLVETRTVTVFNTQGRSGVEIVTNAQTWGDLQTEMTNHSISFKGMKAVTDTKVTLESKDAELKADSFILFLMPVRTKSGVANSRVTKKAAPAKKTSKTVIRTGNADGPLELLTSTQIRSHISNIIKTVGDKAKAHFNKERNYTTKGGDENKKNLAAWIEKTSYSVDVVNTTPVTKESITKVGATKAGVGANKKAKEELSSVVESVAVAKEQPVTRKSNEELAREAKQIAQGIEGIDIYNMR